MLINSYKGVTLTTEGLIFLPHTLIPYTSTPARHGGCSCNPGPGLSSTSRPLPEAGVLSDGDDIDDFITYDDPDTIRILKNPLNKWHHTYDDEDVLTEHLEKIESGTFIQRIFEDPYCVWIIIGNEVINIITI